MARDQNARKQQSQLSASLVCKSVSNGVWIA